MDKSIKGIKVIIKIYIVLMCITAFFMVFDNSIVNKASGKDNNSGVGSSFSLNDSEIIYNKNENNQSPDNAPKASSSAETKINRADVLNRAKEMTEVKWIPKYNIIDKYGNYTFKKGKTYTGIPYSMDFYQVSSVSDFLSKINGSKKLYGNDCSGFVSTSWGISRQTTLTFFNAVKSKNKIDGYTVSEVSWDDLKPGDALLLDNGKGKGHIMLYINTDTKNSDRLNVYEQNISTSVPFEAFPVARKDIRSRKMLQEAGYIPIRLSGLN